VGRDAGGARHGRQHGARATGAAGLTVHRLSSLLLALALVLLAVALVGHGFDAFAERTIDWLALFGLALLASGQALRATREQSLRAWLVLALVVGLAAYIALS
jgi:hypothetical protein